jgi:hypothetical protein
MKNDIKYLENQPNLSSRICTFIQSRIDPKTFTQKYNLVNLNEREGEISICLQIYNNNITIYPIRLYICNHQ